MDIHIQDIITVLKARFSQDHLQCIETGTIRNKEEKTKSTLFISEALGDGGKITSVDNNRDHINISKKVCKDSPDNIIWIHKDSIELIKETILKFHFAYLDSANDAVHIFEEFEAIIPKMIEGSVILIDNAGIKSKDIGAMKGWRIYEFLLDKNIGYKDETWYTLLEAPHGNRLKIVLYKEVLDLIKKKL